VRLGTVPLKDEELSRYLEYGKKQLLLTVVALILIWLIKLVYTDFVLPTDVDRD